MQKRVLAFLMVMAMVLSLLPVAMVAAETEAAADFTVILQKAHNQTEGSLAVDIYLQAKTAGEVTGYQFTVTPAEGLTWTGVTDNTGNDNIKASEVVVYDPAGNAPITLGEDRVWVATVTVTGETLPATASEALSLTDITVTTADGAYTPVVTEQAVSDVWAETEGTWLPLDQEAFDALAFKPASANYFLIEDITTTKQIVCSDVNLDLNGFDIAASGNIDLLKAADNKFLTIDDCTATGSALDGTLKAGTLVAGNSTYGGGLYAGRAAVLTVSNVILDGSAIETSDSGNLLYSLAKTDTEAAGKLIANNVHIFGGKAKADSSNVVVMGDARGYMELNDVRFSDFDLTPNPEKDATNSNALLSCRHQSNTGILVMNNVIAESSNNYSVYMMNTTNNKFGSATIKGDTRLADPVFVASGAVLTLDLGTNASVILETEEDLTAEELGTAIQLAEGATLPAGTLLYKNVDLYVDYTDGAYSFAGHAHKAETFANGTEEGHTVEGMSFKAWSDYATLPTDGNWYLTTDVTMSTFVTVTDGETLNLDLNGHTVTQTGEKCQILKVNGGGTVNLFDCQSGYDADGNWTGGKLTGGTGGSGGAILLQPGAAAGQKRAVLNMYGGSISGNHTASSGGAVYVGYSAQSTSGNRPGAMFNMYGGEIANNTSNSWGGAVTVMGYSHTASSGNKGVDPAEGLGGQFNLHGGKIYGNKTYKASNSTEYAQGTIKLTVDAVFNMTGGEIFNNEAELGGAVFSGSSVTTVNISGGKIYGNTAVEDAYKKSYAKFTTNTSGAVTGHTSYIGKGGAIYCNGGQVTIKNIEISGNTSTQGGAIYAGNGSNTNLLVENCVIDGNLAKDFRTEATPNTVDGSTYTTHNQEWGNGGGVYILSGTTKVTLKDCQITNNTATRTTKFNDYQGMGGGVYTRYGAALTIDGCTFTGNSSTSSGGALALRSDGSVVDVKNCVITGNTSAVAGAGAYVVNKSTLKLTDTVIYRNKNTGTLNGGGVYMTSTSSRIIVSGKVVIAENANKSGDVGTYRNLYWQSVTSAIQGLEVNELGEGSHIEAYVSGSTQPVVTADVAGGYVKVTEGGTQSDWDCGWITMGANGKTDRQLAYIDLTDDGVDNKTFEWGHYHKRADGTYYLLNEWTSTTSLPTAADENGVGYYLTADVTITAKVETRFASHNTAGYDYELCLNGYDIDASGSSSRAIILRSANAWIGDCTASYDENGHLLKGGELIGAHTGENGGSLYFTDDNGIGANITLDGIEVSGSYETVKRNGTSSPGYAGGAVHVRNKNNTTDKTDMTIIGCKFTGNHTPMEGGAITSLNGADLVITDTVFEGNYAGRLGGAIAMVGASGAKADLVVDNCRFVDNYVTTNPTKWTDDTATDVDETITPIKGTGQGGAIYATQGTVTVKNSYFEGNKAINAETLTNYNNAGQDVGMGGAIFMTQYAALNVEGSSFVENHALYEGGAIYMYGQTNNITTSTFTGNTAEYYGGALFTLNTACVLNVSDCVFTENTALGHTYTKDDGTTATADGFGGAVELMNGAGTFTGCEFYNNTARVNGGAARLGGGGGTIKNYTVENCYFEGNKANSSSEGGGALYIRALTEPANIINSEFVNNEAASRGGAVLLYGGTVTQKVDTDGDGVTDTTNDLTDKNVHIIGGTFTGNSAVYGGAIYGANNLTLTVEGAEFEENEGTNGGVIYTSNSTVAYSFNNCNFTANTAKNGGVGCADWQKAGSSYTGCTFTDNVATNCGGALYIKGNNTSVVTIGGEGDAACTFTGNQASSGGAIWCGSGNDSSGVAYTGTTNIINSTFTENVATNDVSAIKSCNAHKVTVTDCTITDNTSKQYGALHVATSNASLTLAGKMIVTDNVSTNYVEYAENADLFFRGYTDATIDARVDVSGLTEGSTIGVMVQDDRMANNPDLTMNGGADKFGYFYSNSDRVILTTKDNEIYAVKYIAEDGTLYGTVQAAINAAETAGATTFKLQASTTEELTLTTVNYLDLNGKDAELVTVAEGTELTLVDTATNDYDVADGYGKITVVGDVKAYVADTSSGSLKRYVLITHETTDATDTEPATKTVSAHRIYLAITAKTLRPTNGGVGFKAIFAGDQVITESVVYGVELSGYSDFSEVMSASFDTMEPGALTSTPNLKTVVIYDAITAENTSRWDADLYGRPFITVAGQTIYGTNVTVNMKSMATNALASGDQTIIDAVNAMMEKCGVSVN